ncbi:MAG TPA: alpha/beta hydrolase [Chloroflexia bacterium]|nr:alpha/beta hydrolase [Chloroflexia bacterium]
MPWIIAVLLLLAALVVYVLTSWPKLPPETDGIIKSVLYGELPELVRGQTGYASSGGLRIWYESIRPEGSSKGAALLIMSTAGSALDWPPAFVRALVDAGYQVIRYDHRGTGLSDWVENWDRKHPYTLADMAGDAVAVLDALGVREVHVVGLSLGGMVAQELAANYPGRVASLTLMSTSGFIADPTLPSLTSAYFISSLAKGLPLLKYRLMGGEANLIKERIAKMIVMVGREGLDIREMAEVVVYQVRKRRGTNFKAIFQHLAAVNASGSRYDKLATLHIPTLVIHGTADQVNPAEHGKKLVEVMPNAQGLWLKGVGHVFPYPNMDDINRRIVSHFESNRPH